jgi:hypothetical protein
LLPRGEVTGVSTGLPLLAENFTVTENRAGE